MRCVTPIPLERPETRRIRLLAGNNVEKGPIMRNAMHWAGNIDAKNIKYTRMARLETQEYVDISSPYRNFIRLYPP